jgi:hypothetical protein
MDEQKANARGIPPIAAQSNQAAQRTYYKRHELIGNRWRETETTDPAQPANGFTVSARFAGGSGNAADGVRGDTIPSTGGRRSHPQDGEVEHHYHGRRFHTAIHAVNFSRVQTCRPTNEKLSTMSR